jgi:hypothetical protein
MFGLAKGPDRRLPILAAYSLETSILLAAKVSPAQTDERTDSHIPGCAWVPEQS